MRITPLLPLLAACAWDAPLNPFADPVGAGLVGTVVLTGPDVGNVIVLAYDAANPGPPIGTGRPVTFTTVSAEVFTTDAASGFKSAPFAFTDLPLAGRDERSFLVTGLLDVDGNFNPVVSALGGATCGDWIGAYLGSLTSTVPAPVTVPAAGLVEGVTVVVASELVTQRPAFYSSAPEVSRAALSEGALPTYRLTSTAIHTDFAVSATTRDPAGKEPLPLDLAGPCPLADVDLCDATEAACSCDPETTEPCDTAFHLLLVDDDGDGALDPYPAEPQASAGLNDVWPRVYLAFAGDPLTVDDAIVGYTELDSDPKNNILTQSSPEYPYPERWIQEGYPFALGLPFDARVATPLAMHDLSVLWSPVYRHYFEGGTDGTDANGNFDYVDLRCADPAREGCPRVVDITEVPLGLWQLTVILRTGQTWSVPNEIGWYGLSSTVPDGFDPTLQRLGATLVE